MKKSVQVRRAISGLFAVLFTFAFADAVAAVGVDFSEPASGWFYAYDGDEAYYNDPDGPNPDYQNGTDANNPGGQGGTAALVFPGFVNPMCDPMMETCAVDNGAAMWEHKSSNWEGSAPGDALGGTPGDPPPLTPPAPGGVGAFTDVTGGTTFIRLQDPGNPKDWGWADKGVQGAPGAPRQEGNNRKIQFSHEMTQDPMFSSTDAVIDNGITISFRARLATAATGPIDKIYFENQAIPPTDWPEDGLGYQVANDGRGMFMITQTNADGVGQQMAFSLIDNDTITFENLGFTPKTGLVMNNRAGPTLDVDTNAATDETLNIVEIPDEDLDDWHEFWITVDAFQLDGDGIPIPDVDDNTHEVNVYMDGDVENPLTFQTFLSFENEFGSGSHLGLGLSSGSRLGAFDVDFFAYAEGIILPEAASGSGGDFNDDGIYDCADIDSLTAEIAAGTNDAAFDLTGDGNVDLADRDAWLAEAGAVNLASGNPYLLGDANLDGVVDASDFNVWNGAKFTATAAWCQGDFNADGFPDASDFNIWNGNKFTSSDATAVVPEPTTWALMPGFALLVLILRKRRHPFDTEPI